MKIKYGREDCNDLVLNREKKKKKKPNKPCFPNAQIAVHHPPVTLLLSHKDTVSLWEGKYELLPLYEVVQCCLYQD